MEISQEPTPISNPVKGVFPNNNPRLRQLEKDKEVYEEKLKHYESEMQSKDKELQLKQNHIDGMDTIDKLFQETRRDLSNAEKRNKTLEIAINNLQNRLMQNGLNHDCAISEEDVFIPGPSKQIMDNLVRENVRLKSLSREAEEMQPLRQKYETHIRNLQQEVEELQQKSHPPVSQQDGLIREQQVKIEKMEGEINKLEQERMLLSSSPQSQVSTILSGIHVDYAAEMEKLKSENRDYVSKLNELMEMNKRWKLYNDQQESKIQKLHAHIQTTKSSPANDENMQKLLLASRQQIEYTLSEKQQIQDQVTHLDEELKTLQEAFSAQGEELRQTTEELMHVRILGTPEGNHIDALKAQIQICTEDFECERKDRETAQSKLTQVEAENQKLRREINRLQMQVQQFMSATPLQRPQFQSMNIPASTPPNSNNHNRNVARYNLEPEIRLNARGNRRFDPANDSLTTERPDGWLMVDGVIPGKGRGQSKSRGDNSAGEEGYLSQLQCPNCGKEYDADQHNELLEHTGICHLTRK